MSESFVDLTYRGLPLGRRIKLTQVRPSTGYLEIPAPMPVGSAIVIATDDGITIDAIVAAVQEQVGGIDRAPGMIVKPALTGAAVEWWKARVALPDEVPRPRPRARVTVRPRSHTQETPPPSITDRMPAVVPPPPPQPMVIEDDNTKRTTVMNAVDQELLEQLTRTAEGEQVVRSTAEHAVVDDGKRTVIMESVDVSAIEVETAPGADDESASDDDDDRAGKPNGNGTGNGSPTGTATGTVRRRKKKR